MATKQEDQPKLQATLCEIECGLYYVTYRSGRREVLPVYQVGCSADDARRRIERIAALVGYETVEWFDHFLDPPCSVSQHAEPSGSPKQLIHS